MTKSFFRKMLSAYILVAVVTIAAISGTISYFMERGTYLKTEKLLQDKAAQISEWSAEMASGQLEAKDFNRQVKLLEKSSNVRVSVIRKRMVKTSGQWFPFGEEPEWKEWVNRVLEGEEVTVKSPFRKNDRREMLIVGLPLQWNGQIAGGIFLYTPLRNIEGVVSEINRMIVLASLLVAVPAVLLLYVVSRRFIRPIILMSRSAKALSGGDFRHRVPVKGKDEVAELARSLNHMAGQLEQVEQRRRRFISEISHELRTPVTTIRASLQGIIDGVVERSEEKQFIRISLDETKRLSKLIDDLLELSSFEAKQIKMRFADIDLTGLLQQTVTQMNAKAREKGAVFRSDIEDGVMIRADADRLKQVLVNLLDNALNHTRADAETGVTLRRSSLGGVKISVWDQGEGIPSEKLPHIFERFYKADESRGKSGAGLGLTISKYIVEAHGGTLSVQSRVGDGTIFHVDLPPMTNL
ncbi:sensor histidine kinase [Ferviditalea candida]|uniref:histidine kinase n=1 Tax=Ferviditalea candida TaxID=3108399 RepID=A0ABU5ZI45_9BACL|nr:ATP-binding protein [Paenibacillaceae bacterium T2]